MKAIEKTNVESLILVNKMSEKNYDLLLDFIIKVQQIKEVPNL